MEQLVRNDFALKGMVDSLEYGDDPSHPELIERAWNFLRSKHQETAPSAKLVAEERVHLKDYKEPTNELLFGTVDVHWVDAEAGVVYALDYKFGHQLLNDHMGGMQIYAYLAALAQWHGMRRGVGWLYLPRHDMQYKVVMEEDDYYHTIDGIKEVIEQCKAEDASLNVGDWCQYCRGNGTCGATAGSILGLEQLREALGKE